jgi:mycothiol synthase
MDDRLAKLIERATQADGRPPFSQKALDAFARGDREVLWHGEAVGLVSARDAQFVVDPGHRGRGLGTQMLTMLQSTRTELRVWANGDHPAAKALAASHGFEPVRTRVHLHAPVTSLHAGQGPWVSSFTEADTEEWLDFNAKAFAGHPELGSVDREVLEKAMAEPWFSREDFLLLRQHKQIVAYAWMRIDEGVGEFFVIGVHPDSRGTGLGRRMVDAGFAHLADRGIRSARVYVDTRNIPAVRLYRSMGFTEHATDVQYRWVRA